MTLGYDNGNLSDADMEDIVEGKFLYVFEDGSITFLVDPTRVTFEQLCASCDDGYGSLLDITKASDNVVREYLGPQVRNPLEGCWKNLEVTNA